MRKIECIVVHHKGANMLSACLESLLASDGVSVGVTVVANECREELPGWLREDERVQVLRTERALGFAEANNYATEWVRANGKAPDAFFFVNDDAAVVPQTLGTLSGVLDAAPLCGAVGPKILIWGAPNFLNSLGLNVTSFAEVWDEGIGQPAADFAGPPVERQVAALTGAALMVRAEALSEVGGWSQIYRYYMEDIDLCLRLWTRGWTVVNTTWAVAYHAISATSGHTADMKRYYSLRNQFLLILIHWPWRLLVHVAPKLIIVQLGVFLWRLRCRAFGDARLQARAWWGAALTLPRVVRERRRTRGDRSWTSFLRAPGSVPVIELPVVTTQPWNGGRRGFEGDRSRGASEPAREGAQ
jgi:GT2 family glycosyltransferase